LKSGRVSSGDERSFARHELAGGLVDFLRAANFLLRTGGRFFVIYLADRLPELLTEMSGSRLEPKRMRMIHSRAGEDARLVMVEGRKDGKPGLTVEAPLIVYAGEGRDYTEEVLAMYEMTGTRDG
jgi:tRNA1Val (adenine37-N6)-methyltransferase